MFLNMMSNKISCLFFLYLSNILHMNEHDLFVKKFLSMKTLNRCLKKKYYQKMTVSAQIDNQSS